MWVSVLDRLPSHDMPVLISEPAPTWGEPPDGSGVLSLAIFKNGEFWVDRLTSDYRARPSHWMAIPAMPKQGNTA